MTELVTVFILSKGERVRLQANQGELMVKKRLLWTCCVQSTQPL